MSDVEEQEVPLEVEEEAPPRFSYQDIKNMVLILDACSQRGAFKGDEMENIGAFRNRLQAYYDYHRPVEEETKDE